LISKSEIFRPLSADLFQKIEADEKAVGKEIEKKKKETCAHYFTRLSGNRRGERPRRLHLESPSPDL